MNIIFKYQTIRRLFPIFLTLILLSASSTALAKSFFWQVKSPTATIYLLGSVHVAKADFYPLDDRIEQAFAHSSYLVVELDQHKLDQDNMRRLILKKGMYQKPDTIESHINEATFNKLKNYLDRYDMPLQGYNRMKPGFLAMTLSIAHTIRMGYLPEYGIDMYFLKKVKNQQVLQLETYEDQLNLFFDMPNEEQFLSDTLDQFKDFESDVNELISAWKNGDTQKMEQTILVKPLKQYPELKDFYRRIFTDRNIKMAQKIAGYLSDKDTYFIVVGAGHFVGQQGIVNLLKQKGFKVTQF